MSNQTEINSFNYLIDPTFTNVNRLFVLLFENEDNRTSFSKYYVPKVEQCVKSVQIRSYVWSVSSCIQTEYGDLRNKSPYSVRIQENTDQK